jgi:hypothetical protein
MSSETPPRTIGQNFRALFPIVILQTLVYTTLNQFQWRPSRPLPLTPVDEWFPFWPWTVFPYLLFFLVGFPVALLIQTDRVLYRAIRAYFFCLAMTIPVFVFWPTLCPRPDLAALPPSWDVTAYRWLIAVDTPACSFPSMHVMLPAIVCWTVFAEGRWWAKWYAAALLLLSVTILTTKQHYAWDWLGGLAIAALALWAAGSWDRKQPATGVQD